MATQRPDQRPPQAPAPGSPPPATWLRRIIALFADWIPVLARQDTLAAPGTGPLHVAWVERHAPGVSVTDDWDGMGQRTTASGTTLFQDVFVPDFHVFLYEKAGASERPTRLLAALIHSAIDLGIAEDALGDARDYIHDQARPWIDNPHATHAEEPFVIQGFGELGLQVRTAQRLLRNERVRSN